MSRKKSKPYPGNRDTSQPSQACEEDDMMEARPMETEAYENNDEATFAQAESPDAQDLAQKLEEAVAGREEYLNLAQRVQADFDNFRRRNNTVRADAFEDGARAFATTLLPVIDNLERALVAAGDEPSPLKEGVQMVLNQMLDAFEKRGITVISRLGENFDPNLENAVMQGTPEDGAPGTVCQVLQKGYQMGHYVLRHAMVKVVAHA